VLPYYECKSEDQYIFTPVTVQKILDGIEVQLHLAIQRVCHVASQHRKAEYACPARGKHTAVLKQIAGVDDEHRHPAPPQEIRRYPGKRLSLPRRRPAVEEYL
jgi:hypothetical protein